MFAHGWSGATLGATLPLVKGALVARPALVVKRLLVVLAGVALLVAGLAVLAAPDVLAVPAGPVTASGNRLRVELADGSGGPVTVPGLGTYPGAIELNAVAGAVSVVNDVRVDDYLGGIAEVPSSWPPAALQAQAIAARTYLVWHMLVNKGRSRWPGTDADICATDACQVYRGLPGDQRPAWDAAVTATANQVLLWKGLVIEAMYSSSNGGRSVSGGVVWLPSVNDPDDAASPLHHWAWTAPAAAFGPALGVASPTTVTGLRTTGNGVVASLQQPGSGPVEQSFDAVSFRTSVNRQMGAPQGLPLALPSGRFSLSTDGSGSVTVDGGGWGHGIGMSQYGALGKARRGLSAAAILASYYGPARPVDLGAGHIAPDVRVLLAEKAAGVSVTAGRPLRVVDGHGRIIGVAPGGAVDVRPGSGGVVAEGLAPPATSSVTRAQAARPPVSGPSSSATVASSTTTTAPRVAEAAAAPSHLVAAGVPRGAAHRPARRLLQPAAAAAALLAVLGATGLTASRRRVSGDKRPL
jgi:stage II sporulation protein D